MGGWKTWTGGIGLILSGVGAVAAGIASEEGPNVEMILSGLGSIGAGLAIIGVGHKLEKGPQPGK